MVLRAVNIDKVHADVSKQQNKWRKVRDAVEGEAAIHAAGPLYLPKLKDEPNGEYGARKGRTPWYNASWRTMAALVGMLYRKDPQVIAPTGVENLLKDVTLTGVPFANFTKELATEVVSVGLVGILVDHPPAPELGGRPLTVAIAEQLGLRPTMAMYKAENFINWKHRRIKNKWTLSHIRLMEDISEPDGEFGEKAVKQIRVLELNPEAGDTYRQRLFRKNTGGAWEQYGGDIVPLMNGKPLDFIPFLFMTANGIVAELDDPPLIDLVDLNVKHYGVSADYEHACHFTALPTPWIAGLQPQVGPDGKPVPQSFYIGSTKAWTFANPDAKVGMLEFTGAGIQALKDNLAGKEAQMAAIGARMLAPEKTGVEAAETLSMRHSGENSVLSSIAVALSLGASMALAWFSQWAGQDGETDVEVNKDFMAKTMDAATLTALMGAWQGGGISEQEFYELLQRGDVVKSDKPFEDHKAEIEANPPMGVLGAQAAIEAMSEPEEKEPEEKEPEDKDA